MTTEQIDREALWHRVSGVLRAHAFVQHSPGAGEHIDLSPQAADYFADRIDPIVMDALAVSERRAQEAEAELSAARGYISELETAVQSRNEVITHRDARLRAVRELCDAREDPDQWPPRQRLHGGALVPASLMVRDIRRALESVPPPAA